MLKRGVSSLVVFVLLLGFMVSLGIVYFNWAKNHASKTSEMLIDNTEGGLVCEEVNLDIGKPYIEKEQLNLFIKNAGSFSIEKVMTVIFYKNGTSQASSLTLDLSPKGKALISFYDPPLITGVKIIPLIRLEKNLVSCSGKSRDIPVVLGELTPGKIDEIKDFVIECLKTTLIAGKDYYLVREQKDLSNFKTELDDYIEKNLKEYINYFSMFSDYYIEDGDVRSDVAIEGDDVNRITKIIAGIEYPIKIVGKDSETTLEEFNAEYWMEYEK